MPELPEVETTRRGIEPYVLQQRVEQVVIRQPNLRWPIPATLANKMQGQSIIQLTRRGKYLLFYTKQGACLLHLGMSGSLRVINKDTEIEKHDHVDIWFQNGHGIRLRDPRRFGALLWCDNDPLQHKLLVSLGVEPLTTEFNADYLYSISRQRKRAIKLFLMDSHIVVGVGNIYANEALFAAAIHPNTHAGRISQARYEKLTSAVKTILRQAIRQGGTTLRDFSNSDGKPGYFKQQLSVYGNAGIPCPRCGKAIKLTRLGQRATYYCGNCQH